MDGQVIFLNLVEELGKAVLCRQRKLLIGKSLIKHPLNAQRAVNLSLLTSNCYISDYQLTVSLKKVGLRDDDKFWDSLFKVDAVLPTFFG